MCAIHKRCAPRCGRGAGYGPQGCAGTSARRFVRDAERRRCLWPCGADWFTVAVMGVAVPVGDTGVVLVGHGAVARDCPRELVTRLKALEAQRRLTGAPPTAEEHALDTRIRQWPRTPRNDPYRHGLETLAERLRPRLGGARLVLAFNEFCAPSVEAAVEHLVAAGVTDISVVPSMLTPGGVHSEVDIPQALDLLRTRFPQIALRYAWPVDPGLIADMLSRHLGAYIKTGRETSPRTGA